jgi:hypothetical protein
LEVSREVLKVSQRGKSGNMMDFSMQMGTAKTDGRFGALMVSFGHYTESANVRVEYELARCEADIILLEFILGREEPLKVISRKSRGGLIISNCSAAGERERGHTEVGPYSSSPFSASTASRARLRGQYLLRLLQQSHR